LSKKIKDYRIKFIIFFLSEYQRTFSGQTMFGGGGWGVEGLSSHSLRSNQWELKKNKNAKLTTSIFRWKGYGKIRIDFNIGIANERRFSLIINKTTPMIYVG
jgi:hypothetical protein